MVRPKNTGPGQEFDELTMMYKRLRSRAMTGNKRLTRWLWYVRGLPCCVCGKPAPSQAHHIFTSSMSLKSDDKFVVPLCFDHHAWADMYPDVNRGFLEDWIEIVSDAWDRIINNKKLK